MAHKIVKYKFNKQQRFFFTLWFFMIFSFALEFSFLLYFFYVLFSLLLRNVFLKHTHTRENSKNLFVVVVVKQTSMLQHTWVGCIKALLYFRSQGMLSFHFHFNATKIYKRNTTTTQEIPFWINFYTFLFCVCVYLCGCMFVCLEGNERENVFEC